MSLVFDALLAAAVVVVALRVVMVADAFSAVIGFVAFGLVLGLAWVRLGAVDVALTEVAVGGGVTGLVLLRALDAGAAGAEPCAGGLGRAAAAALSAVVFLALAAILLALPEPAPTLAPEVAALLPATDLGNPVTGVLMVFRGFDTLLETMVLLVALVGVWSLSPEGGWRGAPARMWPLPPSGAIDFLARMLAPVGLVFGIYMLWAGADVPGGKFQGGAVLAAMWVLLVIAGILSPPAAGGRVLRGLVLAGPFVFLAVALAGWAVAGGFLRYPPGFEKPLIILVEVAMIASVAVTLVMLVLGPLRRERAR